MNIDGIENNWEVKLFKDNPTFPFMVIDNWYNPGEEKAVWKELEFFNATPKQHINRAENTIVAKDKNGKPLSNAYRFYIENYYMRKNVSPIFNCMYKQRSKAFKDILIPNCTPYSRSFLGTNNDSTLISYYENSDFYEPHHDIFAWTCLIWMLKEPKAFDGGDFCMEEPNVEIKVKNNRMVMFPSCFLHSVSPVKFKTPPKEIGQGRYTITHFYFATPTDDR